MTTAVNEQPAASAGAPPTGEGLTFEKVWAMFQETGQKRQETDRRMQEIEKIIQEIAELQKETDRRMQETDRKMQETDRITRRNGRQMGYLQNRFGEMAEHLVAPGIYKRFNELGYHFDAMAAKGYIIRNDKDQIIAEVDILLENGSHIMAVEVKATPRLKDIEHHVKRLEILRENRDKLGDKRKIQGAIAGAVFGSEEKQATIEAGFYVIEQSGDTVKINVPEGFVPGEW